LRIGFFTDTYIPNVDGVVRTVVDLRSVLESRGNTVSVFTAGSPASKSAVDPRVFYHRSIPFPPYPQYKVALFPYLSSLTGARKEKLEIVHSHAMASMGPASVITAKTLKLPLIGTFHTMLPNAVQFISWGKTSSQAASSMVWRALEFYYDPFDVLTAPSKSVAKILEEHGIAKVQVIPNGINQTRFCPSPVLAAQERKRLGIKPHEPLILVAGRLSPEKNVPVIVKAAKIILQKIPNAKLLITGEGPAQKEVDRAVKAAGVGKSVLRAGFITDIQLRGLYSAADVMATASTFETQGLCALEALSCGTPVVAANALALPETVREGYNGYLFTPSNSQECAEKILRVLEAGPRQLAKLEENAKKTAKQFSLAKSADKWVALYKKQL
jgi:1,2-diacylglycerol 3-alpha-glucosyltransferase